MDWKPGAVGLGLGVADGVIAQTGLSKYRYAHTTFRIAAFLAGLGGETIWNWNPDITYGLMTAATTLIFNRLPALAQSGTGALTDVERSGEGEGGWAAPTPPQRLPGGGAPRLGLPVPAPGDGVRLQRTFTPIGAGILG